MTAIRAVVVGVGADGSGRTAFGRALQLARASGATLHLVSAFHPGTGPAELPDEFRFTRGAPGAPDAVLHQLARSAAAVGVTAVPHSVLAATVPALTRVAGREGADLIVVGGGVRHRHRARRMARRLGRHATCPVLVVPGA